MGLEVVGLGYCVYDTLALVPGPPDFDNVGMTPLAGLVHDGGGQVGTALTCLARLGAHTGYLGILGDDTEGHWLRKLFLREAVDVARLRLGDDIGTNVCLILVDQTTARRAILCHRRIGPHDLRLDESDRTYIQGSGVLHLDGQFMPAAIQAARWAKQSGTMVCYDGNHPRGGLAELLPLVNWLIVAAPFPAAYTGQRDAYLAARSLLALGPKLLVVTRGERGCEVWTPTEHFLVPGVPVRAVDTTGAGDAFHGAFLYGMLQGWDLWRVASFANAVAAFNCRTLGGRRGLPTLTEVLNWPEQGQRPESPSRCADAAAQ